MADAKLFIISGPSAVGKGTIVDRIVQSGEKVHLSVSATTREPRKGEQEGVNYFFMTEDEFRSMIDAGGFLEYASVHGHFYGTPKGPVLEKLAEGCDVILEIDVQGAMQVKESYPDGIFIFILPPSLEELRKRINRRGTESGSDVELRMGKAETEMDYLKRYDYYVVNDDLEEAVDCVYAIMDAEHHSVSDAAAVLKKIKGEI